MDAAFLPPGFGEFIALGADRLGFIVRSLEAARAPHSVLSMAGSRNVIVRFAPRAYSGRRVKCLSAHYDRHPGSPGANDNSAACVQLLSLAAALASSDAVHDCMIAFTDNEEMASGGKSSAQGSFAIAEGFRRLGVDRPWVFCFDCTGRGSVPVLSSSALSVPPGRVAHGGARAVAVGTGSGSLEKRLGPIHRFAASVLEAARPGAWMAAPTPYSDNLGYVTGGLSAVAITMLPRDEAIAYSSALAQNPVLEHILLRNEFRTAAGRRLLEAATPRTWTLIHGKADRAESLDAEAFSAMRDVLNALVGARTATARAKSGPKGRNHERECDTGQERGPRN